MKILRNQRGIGIGVIIGIVALLAILGGVVASSMGGGNQATSQSQTSLYATSLLNQSSAYRDSFDAFTARYGRGSWARLQLSTEWSEDVYGIFNAQNGYMTEPMVNRAALDGNASGEWERAIDDRNGVYVFLRGVLPEICREVNRTLGFGERYNLSDADREGHRIVCNGSRSIVVSSQPRRL